LRYDFLADFSNSKIRNIFFDPQAYFECIQDKGFRQQLDKHGTAVSHLVRTLAVGGDDMQNNYHDQRVRIWGRAACRAQSVTHGLTFAINYRKFHMTLVS
jgi:hypothetical protein